MIGQRGRMLLLASTLLFALLWTPACSSLEFERDSSTGSTGTFRSTATTFSLLSYDFPGTARSVALGNVADSSRPNLIIEHESLFPYLGWFDWLLDIIGVRRAVVTGTWGTSPG